MYGTLAGALSGRKIRYDRSTYSATVDGRIAGFGKTIRIESIHVHYDLTIPPDTLEATKRALTVHTAGCPAHQSVKAAIKITWDAAIHAGDQVVSFSSESEQHAPTE